MEINDPRKGEGWDELLQGDDYQDLHQALETDENGNIDHEHYGFDSMHTMVNFMLGQGSYNQKNSFTPGAEDMEMKKQEMQNDQWKIPSRLEKIQEYLENGAMRGEIDLDPNAKVGWSITEQEARKKDAETKYTAHFIAYDPNVPEDVEGTENFYIATSWYDTPPEEINLEDTFNLEKEK